MRDESRTLDFRLLKESLVPIGKEELENLRFIPAVNVTETHSWKMLRQSSPSVKLVTETEKFSQTRRAPGRGREG